MYSNSSATSTAPRRPDTYGITERTWQMVAHHHQARSTNLTPACPASSKCRHRHGLPPGVARLDSYAVHATYAKTRPFLQDSRWCRLEEAPAEKILQPQRHTPTAREMYDLDWLATHQTRIRAAIDTKHHPRLASFKHLVDATAPNRRQRPLENRQLSTNIDPDQWLRPRTTTEVDLDDIGALAIPTPTIADLTAAITATLRLPHQPRHG